MQSVESYLTELHSIAETATTLTVPSPSNDPSTITLDLKNVCFNDLKEEELALACALIFHSDASLLSYLDATVINKGKHNDTRLD